MRKNFKVAISYPPLKGKGTPLLSQNRQFQRFKDPTYIYPVVPAYAATMLKQGGFDVIWNDCIAEGWSYDKFLIFIKEEKPDLIAFETKTPVVKQHWKIIEDVKGLSPAGPVGTVPLTVLFGDHVTALPEESMKNSKVDFVCSLDHQETVYILRNNSIIVKPIGEIIDTYFNSEKDFQVKKVFDIKVPVYDRNLRVKFASATKVIRHKIREPLYEIELRSGRKVKVTGSHSVYMLQNSQIIPMEVSKLQKGDYLAVPKLLPVLKSRKEIDLARKIKKDFVSVKNQFLIYGQKSGPKAKIPRYIKVSKELCKILGYFVSEGHIQQAMKPYPAKLIGFTFGPHEEKLVNELIVCFKQIFGNLVSIKKYINKHSISIRVTNPLLPIIFEEVLNTGMTAETKHVPWIIFNTTYQNRIAFLEGYFQGDGTIHINRKRDWQTAELIAKTVSKNLANELVYLFLTLGITGSIKQEMSKKHKVKNTGQSIKKQISYLIRITGKEQIFRLEPIWRTFKKAAQVKRIVSSYKLFRKSEFSSLPINHIGLTDVYRGKLLIRGCKKGMMSRKRILDILSTLEKSNKYPQNKISKIRDIVKGEINFLEIVNITKVKSAKNYVYDFCIDGYEKFVGGLGGIFLHNTGGDYDFLLLNLCKKLRATRDEGRGTRDELESGIWYRENGQVKNTGKFQMSHDLNSLPVIDRDLTKWQLYAYKNGNYKKTPGTYIMSGRDCWWGRCTFCSWPALYPQFRVRDAGNVLDEIGALIKDYKIREIMDDTGTFPIRNWLGEFCEGMIARGYNKKIYFDCNMRFGCLSEEDFSLMKKANFRLLLFGLESANQKTLDRLKKNLQEENIIKDCRNARAAGLYPHITIMFGYPWETYEDAKKTLELGAYLLKKGYAYTVQATIVIPYPGSPLFDECKKNGLLTTEDWSRYDMKEPVMKIPMTDKEALGLVREIYKVGLNPEFLFNRFTGIKDLEDLKYFGRASKKVIGHILDFKRTK